ncbi:MAG TPA: DUF4870 domain-containing protein [Aeromicrobium sp.]|nr:DUF4870 domain-containing protein [Aeromicrobium sp.]HKY58376.1 DUF4870 domain-containing protein [Aeromicrobium sp.]
MTESQEPTNYARNGSAPMSAEQERTWATISHAVAGAAMILSAGTLGFVAALVIYLVYKDKGPFVRQHAADAVNIQLNALLWAVVLAVVGFVLLIVLVGFLLWALLAVVPIVATALHVIGAIKAYNGEQHWSPLTIRFVQ